MTNMRKVLYAAVAVMMATATLSVAQPRGGRPGKPDAEKPAEAEKPAPELKVTPGLFGVANHEKDWYFEIPDSLLGRRILSVTRYVSNTPGASQYGGEEITENMIYWEKASNGNLLLRVDALTIQADEGQDIEKAVKVSSENPIIASIKPEKMSSPGTTRVKVTNLGNGRSVIVRINDRGPYHGSRIIDLTREAAVRLGMREAGTARVLVKSLEGKG